MSSIESQLPGDPRQWVKDLEAVWQAHDGKKAGQGFTDDAVQVWGTNQRQSGPELSQRPAKWFAYATDLQITKQYIAHSDDTIVASWNSAYTSPETGKKVHERGIEYSSSARARSVNNTHGSSWSEGDDVVGTAFSTD